MGSGKMRESKQTRFIIGICFLAGLVLLLTAANLMAGSAGITPGDILRVLAAGRGGSPVPAAGAASSGAADLSMVSGIVWEIRMPRLLAAAVLGGALSVSGFMLQTYFGNPIAGPFVLGIASGAKLVVALVLILLLSRGVAIHSWALIAAAFCGAMLSMGFILLVSRRLPNMALLIVCGVMIGYICSAITDIVVTFADDSNIVNLHNWSMGSFSGIGWSDVGTAAAAVFLAMICAVLLSKPMNAYQLGEAYAENMGVNIRRFRICMILVSSVLSACVTAFAGPISFVGIAVPHLMKRLFGTAKPIRMLPACFLGGAVFCLFCDLIARTVFAPTELSISSVTAVFGVPVVLKILMERRGRRG